MDICVFAKHLENQFCEDFSVWKESSSQTVSKGLNGWTLQSDSCITLKGIINSTYLFHFILTTEVSLIQTKCDGEKSSLNSEI